ncbi:MAG: response regulator transcription factor [bacterium]|nr:response regulator transcription factor [bacterium]
MLRQIVSSLLNKEDDFQVVGYPAEQTDLGSLVESTKTDVVIMASPDGTPPPAADSLLKEHPRLKIFTITPNGREAFRVELRSETIPIREISFQRLVDEIRETLGEACSRTAVEERP